MEYKTITFYKFTNLQNPKEIMGYFKGLCSALDLKGRILVGEEGINAGVSGKLQDIEKFKEKLKKNKLFNNLNFREHLVEENSYHKLVVRVRKEIVVLGEKVDLKKKAEYVSPKKLKKWIDNNEDILILDTRNNYESEIGKFKNAKILPIKTFREFPNELNKLEDLKDKKIVTYCTGGIRCEKATSLMKEKGFKNVFQLKGGIISYADEFPNQGFKGDVFVFDDRLNVSTGSDEKLGTCKICNNPCNDFIDCHNLDCDKLFICCFECRNKMDNTCCEECKNSNRLRPLVKQS